MIQIFTLDTRIKIKIKEINVMWSESSQEELNRKMQMGDFEYNRSIKNSGSDPAGDGTLLGLQIAYWAARGLWNGGKWLVKKSLEQKK